MFIDLKFGAFELEERVKETRKRTVFKYLDSAQANR
jgi:hypothetical protein